jgi:hypothetical protein
LCVSHSFLIGFIGCVKDILTNYFNTQLRRIYQMGCPALGIWVGFLKQPALPGEATPQKNSSKINQKNKNH